MNQPSQDFPLAGVRVLDLTRLLPGPVASLILADLGATVDKVEDPQAGDYARISGPQVAGHSGALSHVGPRQTQPDSRSQTRGRSRCAEEARGALRRRVRAIPSRRARPSGSRTRCPDGREPEARRLRAHRLRPDRTAPRSRRARRELHGARRLAGTSRTGRRAAAASGFSDRRRERRPLVRDRDPGRVAPARPHRARAACSTSRCPIAWRCSRCRRSRACWSAAKIPSAGRKCSAAASPSTTRTRRRTAKPSRSARSSPSFSGFSARRISSKPVSCCSYREITRST